MQPTYKPQETEAILKVFQDLGLEDAEVREQFRQLAEPGVWNRKEKKQRETQEIRNNTAMKGKDSNA